MNVLGPRFDTLAESASKFSGSDGFELESFETNFETRFARKSYSTICNFQKRLEIKFKKFWNYLENLVAI